MLFCCRILLIFVLSYSDVFAQENNLIFRYRNRNERYCKKLDDMDPFYRKNIWENPWYLLLFVILGIIFLLMFLGIIKGLIGMFCSRKMAEVGLGMLVDLPKPLDHYQEKEFRHLPVQYDIGGWPIDPYTYKRTVRVLPNKTVFCLNLIFFLAYPLALILQLCSLCCCIRNYKEQNETGCFKSVNVIKFNESLKKKGAYEFAGQKLDMYKDDDRKEEEDTNYVINMMKQSQLSLQKGI
ncbi:uncharacterized protein isoform X1 [Leptinotarsa decemlineata]|uniref:uncharacterized protein isoform X1 n=1 Tax=Leptinotarsa decemlineata TaxID=7539 RepID=UPI003D30452F